MSWINLTKLGGGDNPLALQIWPAQRIERGISMRRYGWNKPAQQIADEAGVNVDTINKILRREPVSTESYAKLTSYLATPAGKSALINNRAGAASEDAPRRDLMRKLMGLTAIAIKYGVMCRSRVTCDSMTYGELKAYFYRLDHTVKERILKDPKWPSMMWKYMISDSMEAWQWMERLDKLAARQSASRPTNTAPRSSLSR